MKTSLQSVIVSVLLVSCLSLDPSLSGLRQVHLLFRHGDRTPISAFPTDPWKDYPWPGGWGQLTSRGMKRHFQLGQWLRQRYDGFLSSEYSREETVIRSTDTDRTLMSALSNLAGLYPPVSPEQIWNPSLAWQPIPVHTVPQEEDYLLSSHADCPRFTQLQEEIEKGDWMKGIYQENQQLFEFISNKSGSHITDIVKLDYVYDCLLIESDNNLTLPDWTKKIFPDGKFKDLRDLSFTVDTLTEELKRLKGGPLVKEMIEHFTEVKHNKTGAKLYMYSAHDTTVAPVLHTLNVFNGLAPPYASLVIVELLDRGGLHVQLSYRNDSSQPPYSLTLPGCDSLCPLEQFVSLTAQSVPLNILAECGVPARQDQTMQRVTLLAALTSSIMAAAVLIATVIAICRGKKKSEEKIDFPAARYHRVETQDVE